MKEYFKLKSCEVKYDFFKNKVMVEGLQMPELVEKEELIEKDSLEKGVAGTATAQHKYLRREGTPGKYRYIYAESEHLPLPKSSPDFTQVDRLIHEEPATEQEISEMRFDIASGTAGERIPLTDAQADPYLHASYRHGWIQTQSSFPEYFQNKGLTKDRVLHIFDKKLAKKKLTTGQEAIIQDLVEDRRRLIAASNYRAHMEKVNERLKRMRQHHEWSLEKPLTQEEEEKLEMTEFNPAELEKEMITTLSKSMGDERIGHKYIRREGMPQHYHYIYKEGDKETKLETVADVEALIKRKGIEYGSTLKYRASKEYADLYPNIKKIYDNAKQEFEKKGQQALQEAGLKIGDRVVTFAQGMLGGRNITGKLVSRNNIPYVKLDTESASEVGKRSVMWNKGWKKEVAKEKLAGSEPKPISKEFGVDIYHKGEKYTVFDKFQAAGTGGKRFTVSEAGHGEVAEFDSAKEAVEHAKALEEKAPEPKLKQEPKQEMNKSVTVTAEKGIENKIMSNRSDILSKIYTVKYATN